MMNQLMLFKLLIVEVQYKKTDYNTKINEIENKTAGHNHGNKYFTTQEFNKLTTEKVCFKIRTSKLSKQK